MCAWRFLGSIDAKLLESSFGKLRTCETIITEERIEHIKKRHPIDFSLFEQYGAACIQNPDWIIEDCAHEATIFMVKRLPDIHLNAVVHISLDGNAKHPKNSVLTFYRIRERNLKKLILKNNLLYKRE